MSKALHLVRDRFHPLHRLRGYRLARTFFNVCDVPIWVRMPGVPWKVRARLIRHASTAILPGGTEPGIYALLLAIIGQVGVRSFWDVGANIGYYSWLVVNLAPGCASRLFEPEPENVELIEETIRRNQIANVTLRPIGVSDRATQRVFIRDAVSGFTGGFGSCFSQRHYYMNSNSLRIETATIDDERAACGETIDLIKLDVEGHEEAVIRGAHHTIETDQPIIIFECFHGAEEINRTLAENGYLIADAERMQNPSDATTNFVAIPSRFNMLFAQLSERWQLTMTELGLCKRGRALAGRLEATCP